MELAKQLEQAENKLRMDKASLNEARKVAEELELRKIELENEERVAREKRAQSQKTEEEFFTSLQKSKKGEENLELLKKKLGKLQGKYKSLNGEIADLSDSIRREREDLLEQSRELTRHMEFQDLLLQYFIPEEQSRMIEARAIWDDARNMYVLKKFDFKTSNKTEVRPGSVYHMSVRGNNAHNEKELQPSHRPVSVYEMEQRLNGNGTVRYAYSNLMQSALDIHERTTQDISDIQTDFNDDGDDHYQGQPY